MSAARDHGGRVDAARAQWGGAPNDWLDLSTGINPVPYPLGDIPTQAWTHLPDSGAQDALIRAARQFWSVPDHLDIIAAPGASALIARMPDLIQGTCVHIPIPTYNEHAASFSGAGWQITDQSPDLRVVVHPNNPDGRLWTVADIQNTAAIIDESFCDVAPDQSLIRKIGTDSVILKSFGKFWGLAGLRLGFAIAAPGRIADLRDALGPWPVSGPALSVGTQALSDVAWAHSTRARLKADSDRLDHMMRRAGASLVGGTTLFRLYEVDNAAAWQDQLAAHHIWSRIFPYSKRWLRLGLPAPDRWSQLEAAL